MTYEEFKESRKDVKYSDGTRKCIVCGKIPAYWEVEDARYYCSACEEHSGLKMTINVTVGDYSNVLFNLGFRPLPVLLLKLKSFKENLNYVRCSSVDSCFCISTINLPYVYT